VKDRIRSSDNHHDKQYREDHGADKLMAEFFARNQIPFRVTNCPIFRKFLSVVSCLNSEYMPPGRETLSRNLIPELAAKARESFQKLVNETEDFSFSIELDHWEDLNGNSLLGIIATTNSGQQHLLRLENCSMTGHSHLKIFESIKEAIKDIPAFEINSFVTDNASNCLKARKKIVAEIDSRWIQHRCMAHLLNLIIKRLFTYEDLKECLTRVRKLTGFIRGNQSTSHCRQNTQSTETHRRSLVFLHVSVVYALSFKRGVAKHNNRDAPRRSQTRG